MGEVGAIEQNLDFIGDWNRHEDRRCFQVSWTNLPLQRVLTRLDTLHRDKQVSQITRLSPSVLGRFARWSREDVVRECLSPLSPLRESRSGHGLERGRKAIQNPRRGFVRAEIQDACTSVFRRFDSCKAVDEGQVGHFARSSDFSIFDHGEVNAVVRSNFSNLYSQVPS
jgi:hypothetical protein